MIYFPCFFEKKKLWVPYKLKDKKTMKVTLFFLKTSSLIHTYDIFPLFFLKRRNNSHAPKVKSKKALMGVCVYVGVLAGFK